MKQLIAGLLVSIVTLTVVRGADAPRAGKPNIVLIYGDDVGYADVGAYGAELIPTPNIDRLAREGLRFTNGHSTAATCTPSRFSLLTGVYAFRHGHTIADPFAPLLISTNALTLPGLFRQAGYATGIVGKWHLGLGERGHPLNWNGEIRPGPLEVGFDYSFLLPNTNDRVPCVYVENHRVVNLDPADPLFIGRGKQAVDRPGSTPYPDGAADPAAMTYYPSTHGHNHSVVNGIGRIGYMAGGKSALWDDEEMADEFVARARQFIATRKDRPFFLFFSSQDIHVPRTPHPRFRGTTPLTYRGDAMAQLDWAAGEIMKALEEHGLADNTLVIFTSDNGPVYDDGYADGTTVKRFNREVDRGHDASGPWSGGKYAIHEGGTRVPFIIRWPDRIRPGTSDALVSQVDFIASFAELFGIALPEGAAADSRSTLAAFLGDDPKGLDLMVTEIQARRSLRRGDWKYIEPARGLGAELYHLANDPGERNNVIAGHPGIATALNRELKAVIAAKGIRGHASSALLDNDVTR